MEVLRIEYETGYMELIVEAFFPCKLPVARKIVPLINRYCSDEVKNALLSELREMADGYRALIVICTRKKQGDFLMIRQRKDTGRHSLTGRKFSAKGWKEI